MQRATPVPFPGRGAFAQKVTKQPYLQAPFLNLGRKRCGGGTFVETRFALQADLDLLNPLQKRAKPYNSTIAPCDGEALH